MPFRLITDAQAQTTVPGAITAAATTIVGTSTANFTQPQSFGNGQISLTVLDAGNPAWNVAAPLATPYEYIYCANNNTGTNTFSGLTRGVAGTTAHAFFAGAIIAQGLLAEDLVASAPWKFDDQTASGTTVNIPASGTIPASYLGIPFRHIDIIWVLRSSLAAVTDTVNLRFNGDTGANYAYTRSVLGSTYTSTGVVLPSPNGYIQVASIPGASSSAGIYGTGSIRIPFAFLSGAQRTAECRNVRQDTGNGPTPEFSAGAWNNTGAAITSVALLTNGATFAGGTIATHLVP